MTHTYQISGMTCGSCEAKVKSALFTLPDVTNVEVTRTTATITMDKHISLNDLQNAISAKGNYTISATQHNEIAEQTKSWFATYKPLLLIFFYITLVSVLVSINIQQSTFNIHNFMNVFMAGFFLTFSFFKLLDVKGFAESYSMYDIVAKRIKAYGFIYPFIELALGIAFLTGFNPFITNITTLFVMTISIIGVLQSVLNKQKIQCACLGAVFNLPMSTVTIIEDALMIAMSAGMLILM
jgi:copper chaperone CopZ